MVLLPKITQIVDDLLTLQEFKFAKKEDFMISSKLKKIIVTVLASVMMFALVACDYDAVAEPPEPPEPPGTIEENRNPENAVEGFLLTIAVEDNFLPYGRSFRVQVELENLREEDVEISFSTLFGHSIPNWHPSCCGRGCGDPACERRLSSDVMAYEAPISSIMSFPSNATITGRHGDWQRESVPMIIGRVRAISEPRTRGFLPPGEHELTVTARFSTYRKDDPTSWGQVVVRSNTITLTVY